MGTLWPAPTPVILISIDTLRADHLSSYGYRRIQTPHIDSFGTGGTIFTSMAAQVPLTLPSHYSLFTSTYPFESQIEENAERVPDRAATLASVLRAHGYKTAAFIGSVFLEQELGLDQGFEYYDSPFRFEAFSPISGSMFFGGTGRNPYSVRERRDGAVVLRAARQWLIANRGQSVFAFIHLFDLHRPYYPHAGYSSRDGVSGYDGELAYVDKLLGSFQKVLAREGWWERSLVVLISDHGESLGEHGESSHGYFIYQSTLWVPLLIHWPAGTLNRAAEARQPAGLMDVSPTILDFLQLPAPPSFEGQSLLPAVRAGGPSAPHAIYSESVHARDSFGWAPLRSVRMDGYKYIEAPRPELYDLKTDPHERWNLAGSDIAHAREFRRQLHRLLADNAPKWPAAPAEVSPQTITLLGSLGYLAPGPRAALGKSGPDPKDRLAEFRLYETAQSRLYHGDLEEAIADLQRLLAADPHNTLARRDLGGCYVEKGLYVKARQCFKQVLALTPRDYMTNLEMAVAEEHLGLIPDALAHARTACEVAPKASQCRRELEALQRKVHP